jgi:hypothetical protein
VVSQPIGDLKQDIPPPGSIPNSPPPLYPNSPVNYQTGFYPPMNQAQAGQPAPMKDSYGRPLSMNPVGSPMNTGMYSPPTSGVSPVGSPPMQGVSPNTSPQLLQPGTLSPAGSPPPNMSNTVSSAHPYQAVAPQHQVVELPGGQPINTGAPGTYHYPQQQGGAVEVE